MMQKKNYVKIIQISVNSGENPNKMNIEGIKYIANIIGLGDDNKVYWWSGCHGYWILLKYNS